MIFSWRRALVLALLGTSALQAQSPQSQSPQAPSPQAHLPLPPEAAVRAALDQHPQVEAAVARIAAATAQARGLKAGPHELNVTGSYIRRSIDRDGKYDEYDATMMKGIRLPQKARLDKRAGEQGVLVAENLAEDARHQVATALNALWWDWLAASAEVEVDAAAVRNHEAMVRAVERRVALKDAAPLDLDQAAAALADAQTSLAQSMGDVDLARARLAAQFPSLAVPPAAPAIPAPDLDTSRLDEMGRQVVERSHDIAAADAEALRLAALARRAKADRIADPHIGLRLFQERNGAERGAGVVMSIPLGIAARRATADQAAAEATAATAERAAVRASVAELATTNMADLRAKLSAWQFAQSAAQGQQTALARLKRGQALGAIDLADVLQAERLAHAAARIEARARAEAHRAWAKMLIDSHNLWIGD